MASTELPEQKSDSTGTALVPKKRAWTFKKVMWAGVALFFALFIWDQTTPRWMHVTTDTVNYDCMDGETMSVPIDRWSSKPTATKAAACVGHNHPKPAAAAAKPMTPEEQTRANIAAAQAKSPAPRKEAHLMVRYHVKYEVGYVTVNGTVKNVGDAMAFSPIVKVEVYDDSGETILAQSTATPTGQFWTRMKPGVSAAFETMDHIPGEPNSVTIRVSVDGYPYDAVRY
jgi:hypothetical protein